MNRGLLSAGLVLVGVGILGGGCSDSTGPQEPTGENVLLPGDYQIFDFADSLLANYTEIEDPEILEQYRIVHVGVATDNGNLRLSAVPVTFPFIWLANSDEGTISKLNTETGEELGRYRTGPNGRADNPSRTTVDQDGNVWVGNRGGNTVTKVGLDEACQCIDKNNNGVIETSHSSPGNPDVLPWGEDECMLLHVELTWPGVTTPSDIRLLVIDPENNMFVGGNNQRSLFKIDTETGGILGGIETAQGHYGGVGDATGNLWSMSSGTGFVEKISNDMQTTELITLGHSGYGITIDKFGKVWTSEWGARFSSFDPMDPTGTLAVYTQTDNYGGQGIASDSNGDIFIAGSLSHSVVGHYRNDGTFVTNHRVEQGPTGVAVDAAGKVWASNYYSDSASRIDPLSGQVDTFPIGDGPYNYSDMTGNIARTITTRQGTWTARFNSEADGFGWSEVIWELLEQELPAGTRVEVAVRAADEVAGLGGESYVEITSGQDLVGVLGQYLQLEIRMFTLEDGYSEEITSLKVS